MTVPPRMLSTALYRPAAGRGWRPGQISRSLPHGHVAAALDTIRQLGLEQLIDAAGGRQRDLVSAMITAAVIDGSSELATARGCWPRPHWAGLHPGTQPSQPGTRLERHRQAAGRFVRAGAAASR